VYDQEVVPLATAYDAASTFTSTFETPRSSLAVPLTISVPFTVDPAVGEASETVGGWFVGGGVVAVVTDTFVNVAVARWFAL
jgi:hypothetical protein